MSESSGEGPERSSGQVVPRGPVCDAAVDRSVMVQCWNELTFLHWRFEPTVVQRLVPRGLTVETFDGSAWVSLVPFFLQVGLPGGRSVPWMSRFAETNVRTYVRSEDGASGLWFFSLDAARLGAVVAARVTYRLPYFWSKMAIDRTDGTIAYSCHRRWPGPRGATSTVVIEIGERLEVSELTELDHFLTARWQLFSSPSTGIRRARAAHDAWPLQRARVVSLRDDLVEAAGLPAPTGEPLVHYSKSVDARIGWPVRIAPS